MQAGHNAGKAAACPNNGKPEEISLSKTARRTNEIRQKSFHRMGSIGHEPRVRGGYVKYKDTEKCPEGAGVLKRRESQ